MFEEYRKELKVIFNNLGALDADMVLTTIHEYLGQTLSNWQRAEFKDVEVAITMLYQLAEALPVSLDSVYIEIVISSIFFGIILFCLTLIMPVNLPGKPLCMINNFRHKTTK